MTFESPAGPDWRLAAIRALTRVLASWPGHLRPLADEAGQHLAERLVHGPPGAAGALSITAAVTRGLGGGLPPSGLLVAAAASYLAWDLLDDEMDGDPVPFWSERTAAERTLGAHLLIATAAGLVSADTPASIQPELDALFLAMCGSVVDGQLRGERPLDPSTSVHDVAAGVHARSGTMLAGFAEMAAVAAHGGGPTRAAAHRFGQELAMARQLLNDLDELLSGRASDLRNRTATMVGAFALQRAGVNGSIARTALIDRLQAAADDDQLRASMIGGELAAAMADTHLLARLHLSAARAAADDLSRHSHDRADMDMLLDQVGHALSHISLGGSQ